jgi:hypothetical protein
MTDYIVVDNRPPQTPRQIDYDRMNREWPRQKAALTRARKTGDARKVAKVCIDAVAVWDAVGAWPDDWMLFERTLNDMLHWRQQINLGDVAYGRVKIEAVAE